MSKKANKRAKTAAPTPAVVLFGLDQAEKPHAGYFEEGQVELAIKVAGLIGFNVLRAWDPDQANLIRSLPAGRIYANERGFVPHVRRDLYAKVVELAAAAVAGPANRPASPSAGRESLETRPPADLGAAAVANSAADPITRPKVADPAYGLPRHWDEFDIGHLVIGPDDDPKEDGWSAANVAERNGDMFALRWVQWPQQRKAWRHRYNLGLLYPGAPKPSLEGRPPQSSAAEPGSHYPDSWGDISVGSLVLAKEDGPWQAWWEAIVFEIDGQAVTLRWRDYPELPAVVRPRLSLTLLYPNPH